MNRASLRYWGALQLIAALFFVAQPIVEGVHHLISPHFWCPEHRTYEHATTAQTAESSLLDAATGVSLSGSSSSGDGEHDVCLAISTTHKPLRESASVGGSCVAFARPETLLVQAGGYSPVSLLSCAPKHSPPVANASAPWASRAS